MTGPTPPPPEEISLAAMEEILRAFGNTQPIDRHLDATIAAGDPAERNNLKAVTDTLIKHGYVPAQIYSIRFRPHEITLVMYDGQRTWIDPKDHSRGVRRYIVHIPVVDSGKPHDPYHVTEQS